MTTNSRIFSVCFALTSILSITSADVLAQRGGGGHGGAMGGGQGSGMSSGMSRGGVSSTMPSDRAAERMGGGAQQDRSTAGDRQGQSGGPKTAGDLLQQNSKLSEGLAKLLPAGTDLQAAASGFRNLGNFVAAVHVSNNLGIPFADLKAKIASGDSLGEAIRALRPSADAQVEERKARAKAEDDLAKG